MTRPRYEGCLLSCSQYKRPRINLCDQYLESFECEVHPGLCPFTATSLLERTSYHSTSDIALSGERSQGHTFCSINRFLNDELGSYRQWFR